MTYHRPYPQLDRETFAKLSAHYGPSRAASIRDGTDPQANEDLAGWRRLCALADIQQQRSGGKA